MKKNNIILIEFIASFFLIVSFASVIHAAQSTVNSKTVITTVPPTSVVPKRAEPVANAGASKAPCANYCDKVKGVMVEQKSASGGCQQTAVNSCFPYTCNYPGTLCNSSCTGNSQCAIPNAYCNQVAGKCVAGNNCPSICEGDNKADYIPAAMLPNSNSCRKDKTTSCFPYTCDPQKGACGYNCMSDQQCAKGAMCSGGSCVPAVAHCDKYQSNILVLADGTRTDCHPYLCKGNTCLKNCDSAADCFYDPDPKKSFVCDTLGGRACVPTIQ